MELAGIRECENEMLESFAGMRLDSINVYVGMD